VELRRIKKTKRFYWGGRPRKMRLRNYTSHTPFRRHVGKPSIPREQSNINGSVTLPSLMPCPRYWGED